MMTPFSSHGGRSGRRKMALAMLGLAVLLLAGATLASCGGVCAEVRDLRGAAPSWQVGSLPALGTAYIGREVAGEAVDAWLEDIDDAIIDVLSVIPVIGGLVERRAHFDIVVGDGAFEPSLQGTGSDFVFQLTITGGLDPTGGVFPAVRGLSSVQVELLLRAPLYIASADGERAELRARTADVRVAVRRLSLGPLGASFDESALLERLQRRLLSGPDLVVATVAPMTIGSLLLRVRLIELRHWSSDHVALDFEFVDVAAPADISPAPLLGRPATDTVAVALTPRAALALGDYGLRLNGAEGFSSRGRTGGPYNARLTGLAARDNAVDLEITALRCRRGCVVAEIQVTIEASTDEDGPTLTVQDAKIVRSTMPRWLVRAAMPSVDVLSDRATTLTREVLMSSPVEVPLLSSRTLMFETVEFHDDALLGVARLRTSDGEGDEAR